MMQIELTAAPTAEDREVILLGLQALTQVQASSDAHQSLAVLVRDQDGTVVGGLTGRTFLSWFLVDLFWLPESLRGGGLGTRIMAQAEAEAVRRGCIGAHLNTFSFQAPSFYRRLGYEVFGALDDYPPGHKRVFMCKRFGTTVPEGHR